MHLLLCLLSIRNHPLLSSSLRSIEAYILLQTFLCWNHLLDFNVCRSPLTSQAKPMLTSDAAGSAEAVAAATAIEETAERITHVTFHPKNGRMILTTQSKSGNYERYIEDEWIIDPALKIDRTLRGANMHWRTQGIRRKDLVDPATRLKFRKAAAGLDKPMTPVRA